MAKFTLTIDCDNAAFEGDAAPEIARILGELSALLNRGDAFLRVLPHVSYYATKATLRDRDGNRVGSWHYTTEKEG